MNRKIRFKRIELTNIPIFKECRHREIFDNMHVGIAIYKPYRNGQDFIFTDMNATGMKLDHFSNRSIIGRKVTELFPRIKPRGLFKVFQNVYRTGRPEKLQVTIDNIGKPIIYRENYVYKLPSGEIVSIFNDISEERKNFINLLETKKELEQVVQMKKNEVDTLSGELNETEYRYKTILDYNPDAIVLAINYKFVYVNPAAVRLFGGKSANDLIGLPMMQFAHPDTMQLNKKRMSQLKQKGHVEAAHLKILTLDKKTVDVMARSSIINYKGQPTLLSSIIDISPLIEKETKIRLDNKLLTLKNSCQNISCYLSEVIKYISEIAHWEKIGIFISGKKQDYESFIGFTKEKWTQVKAYKEDNICTGSQILVAISDGKKSAGFIKLASNRKKYVSSSFVQILQSLSPLLIDAIKKYEMENQLRHDNELLEKFFQTKHVLIAYLDKDMKFIRVNKAYAESDGKTPEFFVGKNHFDLYPYKNNEKIFRNVLATGETYTAYARPFVYKNSLERGMSYWDLIAQCVKDENGKSIGILLFMMDVTEHQRMEQKLLESYKHLGLINRQVSILLSLNKHSGGKQTHAILDYVINSATDISQAKIVNLYKFNNSNKCFDLLASSRIYFPTEKKSHCLDIKDDSILKKLIKKKKRIQGNFDAEISKKLKIKEKLSYYILLPLTVNSSFKGALLFGFSELESVTTQELDFYEAFANQAAFVLKNLKAFDVAKK